MEFDTTTLVAISLFVTMVMGVSLLISARKGYPGNIQNSMRLWGTVYILQTVGWGLFVGLKGSLSVIPWSVIGNTLVIWSQAEVYRALCIFDGRPPRRWLSFGLTGLSLLAGWSLIVLPHLLSRYLWIAALLLVVLLGMSGGHLIKPPAGKPSVDRLILGSVFLLEALVNTLRSVDILRANHSISVHLSNTHWQSIIYGGSALVGMLMSIGFLLLCNERLTQELLHLAITDELTGLYNRRKIEQLTNLEIQQAEMSQQPLVFLLFDVDNFKSINDTYGHLAGDRALQVIAEQLSANLRAGEMVGRLGGDEFVVILPNTSISDGQIVAERLVTEVCKARAPFDGKQVRLGISYGMTAFSSGNSDFAHLVRAADEALYSRKQNRRTPTPVERLVT